MPKPHLHRRWYLICSGCLAPRLVTVLLTLTLTALTIGQPLSARSKTPVPIQWLQTYLQIDTTNPPGNEALAVEFLAKILHDHGHSTRRFITAEGRTSLLAKITVPHPAAKPLLLLHHVDVVPAGDGWTHDPFGGTLEEGTIYGRGTIDSKSLGIAHLAAFLELAKAPEKLDREIWFLASADEEDGGGEGVGWIFQRYPEELSGIGSVLTEAGANRVSNGKPTWWGIEVAQKRPLWIRLETQARGGHGSGHHPRSATHLLVRALDQLLSLNIEPHLSPAAFQYFRALAPFHGSAFGKLFDHPSLLDAQMALADAVRENRLHKSLLPGMINPLTDTVQITTLGNTSHSINVVAARASASLDIRLLPDTDAEEFLQRIRDAVGEHVKIEVVLRSNPVPEANINEQTYRRLANFLRTLGPVVPTFIPGTTDSRYFRERGIAAYGFSPFLLTGAESRGIHGPNESIPATRFLEGVNRMIQAVRTVTTLDPRPFQ